MVSISELQLNDAEETLSKPCNKIPKDAQNDTSGPGTPDAPEQAEDPCSFENGKLMEEERKQRAEEVSMVL